MACRICSGRLHRFADLGRRSVSDAFVPPDESGGTWPPGAPGVLGVPGVPVARG
ncbi:hypothetical protein ACLQ2R_32615 [Streptosporangium sp. DT93]|uniref:hypothetical protein n=1 Tax=Streptosporangium sp. DT93 TaxID=3393428 RepID=UPI003CF11A54